jgi:XTP/dITP diphosphohydrolase
VSSSAPEKAWVLATSNPHKLREVLEILGPLGVEVQHLGQLNIPTFEPEESGATFEANARIKALSYASQCQRACLAEDSGLEVDALAGSPGVHSARYSGVDGDREQRDRANNAKLLREMAAVPDAERAARFVCALCLAQPDGTIVAEARGTYEGVIARQPRGENGFGYDPLLLLPELGLTSAELSSAEKHARSHRGQALRRLLRLLAATG